MSEVKSIGEVILKISKSKEYENSAIAQWYNRERNNMGDVEFVSRLIKDNHYLTTKEEKSWYRSALYGALNWGYKIDHEQDAYRKALKRKRIIHIYKY